MKIVIIVLGFAVAAVLANPNDAQQSVQMVDPNMTHHHPDDIPMLDKDGL